MASERKQAKAAVQERLEDDPEFDSAISGAHQFELQKRRDEHAHKVKMAEVEGGVVAKVFGRGSSAATNAAHIVICGGFVAVFVCAVGLFTAEDKTVWERGLQLSGSIVLTALAYLFGRGSVQK